jgi:ribA/ribD-fused uncharacterized protein
VIHPSPDARFEELLAAEIEGRVPPLLLFWSHTANADHPGPWVLSQWWPSPIEVDGVHYRHAEGYMMAAKARVFDDMKILGQILDAEHPGEANKLGRLVQGFDEMEWQRHRFEIVVRGNLAKFSQSEDLRAYLLSTAPRILVEASPRDRIWGIGLVQSDLRALEPSQWRGRNLLGFALTEVRARLTAGDF